MHASVIYAVVEGVIEHNENYSKFHHLGTGYELTGAHVELDCRACHVEAYLPIWQPNARIVIIVLIPLV